MTTERASSLGIPDIVKGKGWEVQKYLAEEEKKFGSVGEHRGPEMPVSNDEENKVQLPAHPLLAKSVQHSGTYSAENPNVSENKLAQEDLKNQLQNTPTNKLNLTMQGRLKALEQEKQYQNSFKSTPTPRPSGF